jgi:hypothetical protein
MVVVASRLALVPRFRSGTRRGATSRTIVAVSHPMLWSLPIISTAGGDHGTPPIRRAGVARRHARGRRCANVAELAEQAGPRDRAGDGGQRARHHRARDRGTAVGAAWPDLRGRKPDRRRRHHRRRFRRQVGPRRLHHSHSLRRGRDLPGNLRQSAVRHRARLCRGDTGGQRAAGARGLAGAAQIAQGPGGGGEGEARRRRRPRWSPAASTSSSVRCWSPSR